MRADEALRQNKRKAEPNWLRFMMNSRLKGEFRSELKHASYVALAIDIGRGR
jgi:hypothetical protein